jgi:PAS domain S-box-containing protein
MVPAASAFPGHGGASAVLPFLIRRRSVPSPGDVTIPHFIIFNIPQDPVSLYPTLVNTTHGTKEKDMYRVLYVDDEPGLLEIGRIFLERSGQVLVDVITSAPAALTRMQSASYDAIVADYQMPEMDGIAFLKNLRKTYPDLPFILFTGRGREEVVIEAINSGADSYLQKGGDPTAQFAELLHRILIAIERRQAVRALKESEDRYRAVVEAQTELISRFRPDGTHIFVNEAYCRYFGKTASEILGTRFHPAVSAEDERAIRRHLDSLKPEHPGATMEHAILMPDGKTRWQQWNDRAIFDASGQVREYQSVGRDITERKKNDDALKKSQILLNEAMDLAQMVYWEMDVRTGVFTFNDRFFAFCGTTAEREGGYQVPAEIYVREFVHPEDRPAVTGVIQKNRTITDPRSSSQMEHRIIRRDGTVRTIHVRYAIEMGAEGTSVKLYGANQDITERKNAERELVESEKKYRSLLEGLYESILVHRDTKILYVNPACEKVLGYSRDALLGQSILLLVPPEFQEMVTGAVRKRMAGKTFEPYELDLIRRDGSRIPVLMSGNLVDFEGAPASINLIIDISARKRAETALQESEKKYRAVIESIQDVFYRTDTRGNLTMASPSLGKLLGYDTLEECLGKNIAETMYYDPLQRQAFLDEIHRNGSVTNYEVMVKRKDGTSLVVSTSSHLLADDSGKVIGVEGIFRDITAQKTAEADLEKSHRFLEAIVQGSPVPTFVIDKDHRVISWNRALEEYSGIPAADVLGVPKAWKAFYQVDRPCLADLIVSARTDEIARLYRGKYAPSRLNEGAYEATDFFPCMKGGTWLFFTAAPIRDADGTVIGAVEVLQDVTALQKKDDDRPGRS